jgi:hypothetical protein
LPEKESRVLTKPVHDREREELAGAAKSLGKASRDARSSHRRRSSDLYNVVASPRHEPGGTGGLTDLGEPSVYVPD